MPNQSLTLPSMEPSSHRPVLAGNINASSGSKWNGSRQSATDTCSRNVFLGAADQSPLEVPSGPIDTAGLTHAELIHHFWYFFRHQVGALKDSLADLQLQVASIESVPKSDFDAKIASVEKSIVKVDNSVQSSEKAWKQETACLSAEIERVNRKLVAQQEEAAASMSKAEVQLRQELEALDSARLQHEERTKLLEERVQKNHERLDVLTKDIGETTQEHRTTSAELRELITKSTSNLGVGLQLVQRGLYNLQIRA